MTPPGPGTPGPPEQPGPPGFRDLLAVPAVRALLLAHVVSLTGTVVAELALSVLVYARTRSSLLSAATLALGFLPHLLGGTVLSGLADRQPVRRLLVTCDLLSAAIVGLMLIPDLPVAALLALVVALGAVAPVFGAARGADLADALPGDLWLLARAALRTLSQVALVGGFAVGGLALTALTPAGLLVADIVSFVASALLIGLGTPSRPARRPAADGERLSLREEARTATRLLTREPRLRRLLLLAWLPWTFVAAADGLAAAYAADVTGRPRGAGVLMCALAGGVVVGELVAARLTVPTRRRIAVPLAVVMPLLLLPFALRPALPAAAAALVVVGLAACYGQGLDDLLLQAMPQAGRGRVLAVQGSGLMLMQGVGILGGGAVAELVPPGRVLAGGGLVGGILVALASRTGQRRSSGPEAGSRRAPLRGRPRRGRQQSRRHCPSDR